MAGNHQALLKESVWIPLAMTADQQYLKEKFWFKIIQSLLFVADSWGVWNGWLPAEQELHTFHTRLSCRWLIEMGRYISRSFAYIYGWVSLALFVRVWAAQHWSSLDIGICIHWNPDLIVPAIDKIMFSGCSSWSWSKVNTNIAQRKSVSASGAYYKMSVVLTV